MKGLIRSVISQIKMSDFALIRARECRPYSSGWLSGDGRPGRRFACRGLCSAAPLGRWSPRAEKHDGTKPQW